MILVESLNNTQTAGSAIVDANGDVWTLGRTAAYGMVVVHNGKPDTSIPNVYYLFYQNHAIYLMTHTKQYRWDGTAWVSNTVLAAAAVIYGKGQPQVLDTIPPVVKESPQGTAIPPAVQIVDSAGDVWTRASQGVACNGLTDLSTAKEDLLLYWNHKVYRQDTGNAWYVWNA